MDNNLTIEDAAILLNMRTSTLTRFCAEGRVASVMTNHAVVIPADEVLRIQEARDEMGRQLAKVRAERAGASIAADLGLDPATAKRLGLT